MDVGAYLADMESYPAWLVGGVLAVITLIGLLTWGGLQATGEVPDSRIDAPGDGTVEPGTVATLEAFSPRPGTCAEGGSGDAVQVRTAEPTDGDGTRFVVNGTVETPNPCYSLTGSVEQEGGGYALKVTSSSSGGSCVQCVGSVRYAASVVVPADRLAVMHDGNVVDVLTR